MVESFSAGEAGYFLRARWVLVIEAPPVFGGMNPCKFPLLWPSGGERAVRHVQLGSKLWKTTAVQRF